MYFPIMIDIKDKEITIIGGGKVALRKVRKLLEYGGHIKVVSPVFLPAFDQIHNIEMIQDRYDKKHILTSFLVIAATNDRMVNKKIVKDCKENHILYSDADEGKKSECIFPASVKRGDLIISVSTNGKSPAFAKKMVSELKQQYDEGYSKRVELLGEIREQVLQLQWAEEKKRRVLTKVIEFKECELMRVLDTIKRGGNI